MIQVSQLTKSFSGKKLFAEVTFSVGKGEVIGLVGRNGSGKSTIFRIILNEETCDDGDVSIPRGYLVGHLSQHINFTKDTLLEECCQVLSEEQQFDFYRAEKILFGLGFEKSDLQRSPHEFSGGYQLRINLTKALLQNPDLLLLDEPTNYLDILSMRWLKRFLREFPGEVILITHDRDFMDSVTTHTMGLHRGKLRKVKGSTAKYYEQLMADEEIYEKTRLNQAKKLKDMQRFVDRFRAKASKASAAQSKMKQIEKLKVLSALNTELTLGFRFNFKPTPAKVLMTGEGLGFSYSGNESELLFNGVDFKVSPGDRIAVIGKNGKGKSTLLNVLSGEFSPTKGQIKSHPATSIGYYQQTHRKNLDKNSSVFDEIASSNVDLGMTEVFGICGAMMFPGDDSKKKISVLSGGEQGRVLLGKILAHQANLLLLDEPSNHLDMESIDVMIEEVDNFPGGVIVVTHNEEILRRLANKLIVFRSGGAELFLGTYEEFLEKVGWEEEGGAKSGRGKGDAPKLSRKEIKRRRAELVTEKSRKLKPLRKEVSELEEVLQKHEEELGKKNEKVMELLAASSEGGEVQEVYKDIGKLQMDVEKSYSRLQELTDQIESISASIDKELDSL